MKQTILAWVAGIIDGEGCIGAYPNRCKRGMQLKLEVNNVDSRMTQKLYELFGGSHCMRKVPRPNECDLYTWNLGGRRTGSVLRQILPYLVIKQEQAILAIEFADTIVNKGANLSDETIVLRKKIGDKLKALKPHVRRV